MLFKVQFLRSCLFRCTFMISVLCIVNYLKLCNLDWSVVQNNKSQCLCDQHLFSLNIMIKKNTKDGKGQASCPVNSIFAVFLMFSKIRPNFFFVSPLSSWWLRHKRSPRTTSPILFSIIIILFCTFRIITTEQREFLSWFKISTFGTVFCCHRQKHDAKADCTESSAVKKNYDNDDDDGRE